MGSVCYIRNVLKSDCDVLSVPLCLYILKSAIIAKEICIVHDSSIREGQGPSSSAHPWGCLVRRNTVVLSPGICTGTLSALPGVGERILTKESECHAMLVGTREEQGSICSICKYMQFSLGKRTQKLRTNCLGSDSLCSNIYLCVCSPWCTKVGASAWPSYSQKKSS